MSSNRQIKMLKRHRRQRDRWIIEYRTEIRAMYREWYNEWYAPARNSKLNELLGSMRFDADDFDPAVNVSGEQLAIFTAESTAAWAEKAVSYTIRMKRRANKIAELQEIQWI